MPQLTWVGKDKVKNHHHDVPFHLLDKLYDFQSDNSKPDNRRDNLLIHGDNLLALKSLLPEFGGRVDCIYIDPPYNTGNEGWVYNDNVNDPRIQKWLGEVVGKEGEDLSRHDKWLCMMYPRLKLLKQLLADDGVIFISIDDNEQAALKLVCDEIFGYGNFVADFIWQHRKSSQNDTDVSLSHNHTLCFAKNRSRFKLNPLPADEGKFSNPDNDPRGAWVADPMDAPNVRENLSYPITNPNTGKIFYPPKGRCWRFSEDKFQAALADNRILFGKTGNSKPQYKRFLSEAQSKGQNPFTVWTHLNTATGATKELMQIFGEKVFDTPKPAELVEYILTIAAHPNAIILDSFAGSGTTAHAVLNLNKRDGGNRRFVCVELMDYAEQTTAERIRRVINGYGSKPETQGGTGGGFAFYRVGDALFDAERNLNPAAPVVAVRRYIAYTEGLPVSALPECERQPENQKQPENPVSPYFLGVNNGTGYLFHYEPDRATDLSFDFLKTIHLETLPEKPERWVVYADRTLLSDEQMQRLNIVFKRIPRDISKL